MTQVTSSFIVENADKTFSIIHRTVNGKYYIHNTGVNVQLIESEKALQLINQGK